LNCYYDGDCTKSVNCFWLDGFFLF
jgi:hypothetical protein